jgi:hypothetical protein
MNLGDLRFAIVALGVVVAALAGVVDRVQAAQHKEVYVARHGGTHTARRICYVRRYHAPRHTTRRICHLVGGYSRLTARDVLWGPAGMPPAPKDFGPHFDFPPASLNDGPTEAPYPGW